jgi:ribosomal subunit interface protein
LNGAAPGLNQLIEGAEHHVMQVSVKGKQLNVGEALRGHVERELGAVVEKYVGRAIEGHAIFAREAHLITCDLAVHFGRGLAVNAHAGAPEAHAAFDAAFERMAKRLRRYKERLREHHPHGREREEAPEVTARTYVLAPEPDEGGADGTRVDGAPVIIAETAAAVPTLSVGEAVMRMDLGDVASLVFRNRAHGRLNVVYRRTDGNIGWVDPDAEKQRQ